MNISVENAGEGPSILSMESFPKAIFLGIAVLVLILLTMYYTITSFDTSEVEMDVFINRLLYSPNTLSYVDVDSGRTYLGIVDLNKLTSENLEKTIVFPSERYISASVSYFKKGVSGPIQEAYINEDWFRRQAPVGQVGIKGPGGFDYIQKEFHVRAIKNGEFINEGYLLIRVLRSRS